MRVSSEPGNFVHLLVNILWCFNINTEVSRFQKHLKTSLETPGGEFRLFRPVREVFAGQNNEGKARHGHCQIRGNDSLRQKAKPCRFASSLKSQIDLSFNFGLGKGSSFVISCKMNLPLKASKFFSVSSYSATAFPYGFS